jgi:uncharacterized membrane protein (UPF0127 family)
MSDPILIVADLERAETFFARLVGLLGRSSLPAGTGMLISPCNQIHTFFMKFAIDVIFLDNHGKVLKIYTCLKPWKITTFVLKARSVIELPAGETQNVETGDYLFISGKKVFGTNNLKHKDE